MTETVVVPVTEGIITNDGSQPTDVVADNITTDRPTWLPDNFKSGEDMAKSYKEAQASLTRSQQELAELKKGGEVIPPVVDNDVTTETTPLSDLKQEDFTKFSEEYWQEGKLSDESYKELADMGLPQWMVDSYAEGQQVVRAKGQDAIVNAGGGQEQVDAMFAWGDQSLPQEQLDGYNTQFNSGDQNAATIAMQSLKQQYEAANGIAPSLVSGGTAPSVDPTFTSIAQVQKAMSDPRYATDPTYRKSVEARLKDSNVL